MARYKADQGIYARNTAFWLLAGLFLFGCRTLYYWLLTFRGDGDVPGGLASDLAGGKVPVLGMEITPALLIALAAAVGVCLIIWRSLEQPKVADMLIESETELRKCTWPTWDETFTSSIVILVVMLFFTAFLAGSDYVLNALAKLVF